MSIAQPVVADVLSASSLIVAIVAAFLGLWAADAKAALELVPERDPSNRRPQREAVRTALNRAVPLALAAVLTLVAVLPRAVAVVIATWDCVGERLNGGCTYNDVSALFVLMTLILASLCAVLVRLVVGLFGKRRDLA